MDINQRQRLALKVLRNYLALTMLIHGSTRVIVGGVSPFGEFLTETGFPFGFYLALSLTIFELVGGVLLVFGYFVPIIAVIFAGELLMGIILVHASEGWFVVGLGRNGMEYSVLLIISFLVVGFSFFSENFARSSKDKK